MNLKTTFFAAFLFAGFSAFAQQTDKTELNTMPVASTAVSDSNAVAKTDAPKTVLQTQKKTSFSLAAGTMFSNYGMASYISPTMYYRLSNKFSVFSSLTYINSSFNSFGTERKMQPMATQNYLLHVGGAYDVTDKLRISGSVWRDFQDFSGGSEMRGFNQPARYGTEFNARYKVSENFTIFGGIRTSNGGNPYGYDCYNSFFAPSPGFGF